LYPQTKEGDTSAVGPFAGPSLGPIIGGALAQNLGRRNMFWFLAIFSEVIWLFFFGIIIT
jgi:hypothetical protein